MTLNHNYGCFSGVGSGIAGNLLIHATTHSSNEHNINKLYY